MADVYPVVHVNRPEVAIEMANLALSYGADGVYLINHNATYEDELIEAYNEVVSQNPDSFIGINLIDRPNALFAFKYLNDAIKDGEITRMPDALWVDDAIKHARDTLKYREENPNLRVVKYLGGLAFKDTDIYTEDPKKAAWQIRNYANFVDVVTTSGKGYGNPPSTEKIAVMKRVARLYEKPLAVASGISAKNINDYNGNIDQILVSTSIEVEPCGGVFVPTKLKEIIDLGQSQK
jgi:hypothetical protein